MKLLLFGGLLVISVISGISAYLAPNDLRDCDTSPGAGQCSAVDAIVAISGGDTEARTMQAVDLYKNGWADKLVFSGAAQDKSGPSNAAAMRDIAIAAGVSERVILIEEESETTKQNADMAYDIIRANSLGSIILVTSPYHQRRANLEFNARAGDQLNIVNHPTTEDRHWSSLWWLTPRGWYLAVGELTKIAAFYIGASR